MRLVRYRRLQSVMAVLVMAAGMAVVPASETAAAPPVAWTYPITKSGPLSVGPSGEILTDQSNGASSPNDLMQMIDRNGVFRWRVPYGLPRNILENNTIYDAAGNVYIIEIGGNGTRMASWNNGLERWNVPMGNGANYGRTGIVFGPDGLLYSMELLGSVLTPQKFALVSRAPADGQVVKQHIIESLPTGSCCLYLFASLTGLAVALSNQVSFISYAGELSATYPLPVPTTSGGYGYFGANHVGEVFASRSPCSPFLTDGCGTAVAKVTTAGIAWVHEFPRNAGHNPGVTPLPDGGVAVADYQKVTTLNDTDGSVRWTWQVPAKEPGSSPYSLKNEIGLFQPHADVAGHVVVTRQATVSCGDRIACSTVAVTMLNGTTGAVVSEVMRPPVFDTPGYFQTGTITDQGRAYVNVQTYTNPQVAHALYAFDLPGAAAAYPSIIGPPGGGVPPPPPITPTLTISPKQGTATIGTSYVTTATLLQGASPVANADIEFRVTQGPCATFPGTVQTVRTSGSGTASFSYSCALVGTDTLRASTVLSGQSVGDTASVRWEPRPGFKYVALGDSYSAGEGVDPYFQDGVNRDGIQTGKTDNRCHRSTRAYAEYVQPPGYDRPLYEIASNYFGPPDERRAGKNVNKLGSDANVRSANQIDWVFWACSGAETDHVYQDGTARYQDLRPQLGNVSVKNADLVTITIGGNDIGFREVLIDCFTNPIACNSASRRSELFTRIDGLRLNLEGLYRRVKLVTGSPSVLVLGYPQIFPDTLFEQLCPALINYTPAEQNFLREAGDRLNGVIQQAAAASQVTYVEAGLAFRDHEVCGSKGAWINGPRITGKPSRKFVDDESFHPTAQGQRAYAEIVNTQLRLRRP